MDVKIKKRLVNSVSGFLVEFFQKTGDLVLYRNLDDSYDAILDGSYKFRIKIKTNGELEVLLKVNITSASADSLSLFSKRYFHPGVKIILSNYYKIEIGRNYTKVSFFKKFRLNEDKMSMKVPFGYHTFGCPWEEEIQELLRKKERSTWSLFKLF